MNVINIKPDSFDFNKNLEFSKSSNRVPSSLIGYSADAPNVSPPFHN